MLIHTSDYLCYLKRKQTVIHLPTQSENVTTLTCELQNFSSGWRSVAFFQTLEALKRAVVGCRRWVCKMAEKIEVSFAGQSCINSRNLVSSDHSTNKMGHLWVECVPIHWKVYGKYAKVDMQWWCGTLTNYVGHLLGSVSVLVSAEKTSFCQTWRLNKFKPEKNSKYHSLPYTTFAKSQNTNTFKCQLKFYFLIAIFIYSTSQSHLVLCCTNVRNVLC